MRRVQLRKQELEPTIKGLGGDQLLRSKSLTVSGFQSPASHPLLGVDSGGAKQQHMMPIHISHKREWKKRREGEYKRGIQAITVENSPPNGKDFGLIRFNGLYDLLLPNASLQIVFRCTTYFRRVFQNGLNNKRRVPSERGYK